MGVTATTELPVWMPEQSSEYIQKLEAKKAQYQQISWQALEAGDQTKALLYRGRVKAVEEVQFSLTEANEDVPVRKQEAS